MRISPVNVVKQGQLENSSQIKKPLIVTTDQFAPEHPAIEFMKVIKGTNQIIVAGDYCCDCTSDCSSDCCEA